MTSLRIWLVAALFCFSLGCGDDDGSTDSGMADAGDMDTGSNDDAGEDDAGGDDAGEDDAGGDDAGEDDAGDVDASAGTPCGDETCNPETQICFECACGGPTSFTCMDVPDGCSEDRTCGCVGTELCTEGLASCTDRGDNHVFCDTGLD